MTEEQFVKEDALSNTNVMKRNTTKEERSVKEDDLSDSDVSQEHQRKSTLNWWIVLSIVLFVAIVLVGFVLLYVNLRKLEAEQKVLTYEAEIETLSKDLNSCQGNVTQQKSVNKELRAELLKLEEDVKGLQNINRNCKRQKEELQRQKEKLQEMVDEEKKQIAYLENITEKSELRLSEMIAERALDRNDGISKLDENSPMKLAEQFRDVYDNEYTDAFEELERKYGDIGTKKLTKQLLDTLEMANNLCVNYSTHHQNSIEQSASSLQVLVPPPHVTQKHSKNTTCVVSDCQPLRTDWKERFGIRRLPVCPIREQALFRKDKVNVTVVEEELSDRELRQIYEIRTAVANKIQDRMMEVLTEVIVNTFDVDMENQPFLITYIQKCLNLCWIMNMHSNPIFIKFVKVSESTRFDRKEFNPFLTSGKYLDYVSWPPLYLHEGGTMLAKGFAEGRD